MFSSIPQLFRSAEQTSISSDSSYDFEHIQSPKAGNNSSRNDANPIVGLSNPQLSPDSRRMLNLVNKLFNTGVQVDIDLPQIVAIGSQSAGKSSVLESLIGVTLPRGAGTCTRCPIECRLSRSDSPWQCQISLRFITDARGQPLGQTRNEVFGAIILDKTQVEGRIRRAQRAILNPTEPIQQFLEGDNIPGPSESGPKFSRNCVCLHISGPDVADLSLCDLPGLIASVSSNNEGGGNDIAVVEGLVTSYIQKASCIILLTVACETDFENQGAHRLAKQYDPEGKRTIGVLTKPDRIPTGEESSWLPFIRNEKEPLDNNWFCVKQPSSIDLKSKITWLQARQREDEFFSLTAPWCELDPTYQKYLRTSNLVERLSLVLSDLISKRLPQIQEELQRTIVATCDALKHLPPEPAGNPRAAICSLLHNFISDLEKHIEGVPCRSGLLQAIRPAQERFRKKIRYTAPNFCPFERKDEDSRHMRRPSFLIEEEGRAWDGEDSEDELLESARMTGISVPKPPRHDDGIRVHATDTAAAPQHEARSEGNSRGTKRKRPPREIIYIDDVFDMANQARSRELPGQYPFVVQQDLMEAIIKEWKEPALRLCSVTYDRVLEHVKQLATKHFAHFGGGCLEQRVKILMQSHITECMSNAERQIYWHLDGEIYPFTLNETDFSIYRDGFLEFYKSERQRYNSTGSMTLAGEMEPALGIMANVRAYFQVAHKRFTDMVPIAIDRELVRGMARGLLSKLQSELKILGVGGYQTCKGFAQESRQVADRRADLKNKLERLEMAKQELMGMGRRV